MISYAEFLFLYSWKPRCILYAWSWRYMCIVIICMNSKVPCCGLKLERINLADQWQKGFLLSRIIAAILNNIFVDCLRKWWVFHHWKLYEIRLYKHLSGMVSVLLIEPWGRVAKWLLRSLPPQHSVTLALGRYKLQICTQKLPT